MSRRIDRGSNRPGILEGDLMRRIAMQWSLAVMVIVGTTTVSYAGPFSGRAGDYYRRYSPGHWVYRHTFGQQNEPGYMGPPSAPAQTPYPYQNVPPAAVQPTAPPQVMSPTNPAVAPMYQYEPRAIGSCQSVPRACCAFGVSAGCSCAPATSAPMSGQSTPAQ